MEKWKKAALQKYCEYHDLAHKTHLKELKMIYAVKASAMHELLEDFDIDAREYYENSENSENNKQKEK